ncbi:MAG: phospho-sugar mutase [Clostridiales bacterium]|nr:phospho-sugar mutase [Clostridiales bacterium]
MEGKMDYKVNYENWLTSPYLRADGLAELQKIANDEKEIEYSFGAEMEFGTAGMRGIIGYGTNKMNVYTVRRATQGLAEFIKANGNGAMRRGVAISYDTRRNSKLFAKTAAGVLLYNGIKVHIYPEPRPVPMLSYAVRKLGAFAGIMITASHNPKEYNGYKVYGEDGAQMSPEDTEEVVKYISQITDYFSVKETEIDEIKPIKKLGLLTVIGKKLEKSYYDELVKLTLSKKAVKAVGKKIKIVYTPVHGSGFVPVTSILKKLGIKATLVEEQTAPDTEFSTVEVPNPEFKETLSMGIALADKIKADVVFGTDPDCDRLGVAIRNEQGEFVALSGNQTGILLLDYILLRLKTENTLPANGVVVKSFVSTGMAKLLCNNYGVELVETPVGFKFIGEKIKQYEQDNSKTYVFGFEESCGYLRGTHARDKDAVVASMLFAEMVCYYQFINKSVWGRLCEIYDKYGYVLDATDSIKYSGLSAMADMNDAVAKVREKEVTQIGIYTVSGVRDYLTGVRKSDGETTELEIKGVNCIYFELLSGGFICLRPSGTEPKLKVYYSVKAKDKAHAEKALAELKENFAQILA